MFLLKLLPGSVTGRTTGAEHGTVDFVTTHESSYGSGDVNGRMNSINTLSAVIKADMGIDTNAKEEKVVAVASDHAIATGNHGESSEKGEQTRRQRRAAPSLTEIVESKAWYSLRREFEDFCASIPADGTWRLDEKGDESNDLKTKLQLRLVESLLPEKEGEDWNALRKNLLQEINSPLRERLDDCQHQVEIQQRSEIQLKSSDNTPLRKELGTNGPSESSLTMRCQLLSTLSMSNSPMALCTHSLCRTMPQTPPQTPPHSSLLDPEPTNFKVIRFKTSAECLFYREPTQPSPPPSPVPSISSISLPRDAFCRHDDSSDEEDDPMSKEDLLLSSEDEGFYNSSAPTSANTSANSTPEKSATTQNLAFKLFKAPSKLRLELGADDQPTQETVNNRSLRTAVKPRTLDIDVPTAIDDLSPISKPLPASRRTHIRRRSRINLQGPAKESTKAGGFKPIFNLNKMTPTREQIAAHINFSNPIYVGKLTVSLQRPCLQCVVANMPCDRGWACSRCTRHGYGEMCLVQRDLGIQEKLLIGIEQYPYIVLVRHRDEEDEKWEKKKALEAELLEVLQDKCDRRNWVIPGDKRRKGGFMGRKRIETRAFEVDNCRGRMWVTDIVAEDNLRVPL
jgi:hypothetical protein